MSTRLVVQSCPRAPFLASGSLCKSLRPASRCYSKKVPAREVEGNTHYPGKDVSSREWSKKLSSRERYQRFVAPSQSSENAPNPQIISLRAALTEKSWDRVEHIYPQIPAALLSHRDTAQIAQLLHTTLRSNELWSNGSETRQRLLLATDRLVAHYRNRILPPHSGASLHLLSIYKECNELEKGKDLWNWFLNQEGDDYLSAAVYGSAIELLACANEPLSELEKLYEKALIRFPGNFTRYHFSAEAIVPDRGQPMLSGKLSITLLQGIFTARVLNGDWRNAYLAFDAALRLFPDSVPRRFFELIVFERPLAEAIQAFKLACWTKMAFNPKAVGKLYTRGTQMMPGISRNDRLRYSLAAMEMLGYQIATGGRISSANLSGVMSALNKNIIECSDCDENAPLAQHNLELAEYGSQLLKLCAPFIHGSVGSSLNTLLGLAGRAKHKQLILEICQTIDSLGTWNDVTHRTLVTAAGRIGEMDVLETAWKLFVQYAERHDQELAASDWLCLASAVSQIGSPDAISFATKQVELKHTSSEFKSMFSERCRASPQNPTRDLFEDVGSCKLETLEKALKKLEAHITEEENPELRWTNPFPSSPSGHHEPGVTSVEEVVYNELTVDPLQPTQPYTKPLLSKLDIPFDQLRFTHWKAINSMLLLADGFEQKKKEAVEDAMAKGGPLKFNPDQVSFSLLDELSFPQSLDEYRMRVLQLRGRVE